MPILLEARRATKIFGEGLLHHERIVALEEFSFAIEADRRRKREAQRIGQHDHHVRGDECPERAVQVEQREKAQERDAELQQPYQKGQEHSGCDALFLGHHGQGAE